MTQPATLKQRLAGGEALFGPWCVIPSGTVMNIIAAAGFDFVIIDLEHGPASFETVEAMARAARSEQVSAIVRLGTISAEQILRSLDCGVDEAPAYVAKVFREFPREDVQGLLDRINKFNEAPAQAAAEKAIAEVLDSPDPSKAGGVKPQVEVKADIKAEAAPKKTTRKKKPAAKSKYL